MDDRRKTKTQLIEELALVRQRLAEQAEAVAAAREQQAWTEALSRAGIALGRTLNYAQVLDEVLEQLALLVPHDAACVMLIEGGQARVFRWYGYTQAGHDPFLAIRTFRLADVPLLKELQETGRPRLIECVGPDQSLYGVKTPWIKSHVSGVICFRQQAIGFLHLASATPGFFSEVSADRVQALADRAAIALHNSQLYDQARHEITQRAAAFKKERNFVSAVLDTAGALVMVLNHHGRILRFNRACEQTTGYRFEEVRGKFFWDLFVTEEEFATVETAFRALQSGTQMTNQYESYWRTRAGTQRLVVWSNTVLLDARGAVEYIICAGSDVTERRQLEERLLAIHRLGRQLNLLRDEADILDIAMQTAMDLLQFQSAGYGLVNEVKGMVDYTYHPTSSLTPRLWITALPMEAEARLRQLISHRHRLNGSDPAAEPVTATWLLQTWLTVPIRVGDYILGVFDFECSGLGPFTVEDKQLLQTLADQTAVALENARLHAKTRQRVAELTTMNVIGQAITSTLDLKEILAVVMHNAMHLLEATAASVVIRDERSGDLWFTTASGGVSDLIQGQRLAVGQGIVGWVIQNGEPALVPDVSQDPRFFAGLDQQTGFITRSVICVPLKTQQRTIGALEVMNKEKEGASFVPEDLRLLSGLAAPATIAIENARLFEQVRRGREQLQSLSRRLVEVQEAERRHIARELHDEAGQALTSLMFGLRLLERDAHQPKAVLARVGDLKQVTGDILQNLHRLAMNLRPASLDHLGLAAALRQYVEQFNQKHELAVQFEVVGLNDRRLSPAVETNLYRIIQEALTNVARHAQASRVDILVEQRSDRLLVIVEDDGLGFEPEGTGPRGRLGLLGMRERTEMLGGSLVIESIMGTGTTVYVEIPYDHSHLNR